MIKLITFEFTDNYWTYCYLENEEEKEITFSTIEAAEEFNQTNNFGLNLFGCPIN